MTNCLCLLTFYSGSNSYVDFHIHFPQIIVFAVAILILINCFVACKLLSTVLNIKVCNTMLMLMFKITVSLNPAQLTDWSSNNILHCWTLCDAVWIYVFTCDFSVTYDLRFTHDYFWMWIHSPWNIKYSNCIYDSFRLICPDRLL